MADHMTVILVHGTWPVGWLRSLLGRWQLFRRFLGPDPGMWSDCPGPFQEQLSTMLPPATDIVQFNWSGLNGIKARRSAAWDLAVLIEDMGRRRATRVYVVAHSHGGNVALDAASVSRTPVAGLVTLATPFISTSRRSWTKAQARAARVLANAAGTCVFLVAVFLLLIGLKTAEMAALAVLRDVPEPALPSWLVFGNAACAIGVITGALKVVDRSVTFHRLRRRARAWKEDWSQYLYFRRKPLPCLAIRATGDEAHAALILAQIFNTAQAMLSRSISSFAHHTVHHPLNSLLPYGYVILLGWTAFVFGIERIAGEQLMKSLIEGVHTFGFQRGNDTFFIIGIWFLPATLIFALLAARFVFAVMAMGLSVVLLLVASLPFGLGLVPLSLWVEAHVETGPTDFVFEAFGLSKNSVDDAQLSFRHSITSLPEVYTVTANWLCNAHRAGAVGATVAETAVAPQTTIAT